MRAEPLYTVMGGPHYGGPLRMGDPSVWPDNVWDASGERHHQWSESPKYRWLERALDTLLFLRVSLCYYEGKLEEYKEKNEGPLPDRSGGLVRDILNFIADRKKRIERLKQTILVLSGPEPSPIPPMSPQSFSRTRGRVAEFIPPS